MLNKSFIKVLVSTANAKPHTQTKPIVDPTAKIVMTQILLGI